SFPSNFTFPFVTLWFIAWHIDISWGSILLMSLGTQWYILFNVIAGASAIPDDLREATRAFHLDTRQRWTKLILPAVFGSWCTGGITAAGGAWNASIVSEIVTYGHTTLTANGLGTYIGSLIHGSDMSPLLMAWLIAAVIRTSVGSATVAALTAGGIVAPLIPLTGVSPELMVLAVGAGSVIFSPPNDPGFWLFKEFFGLTIKGTIRTWCALETIISVAGIIGVMIL
ncbi:MAG: ABC transporter permease subunit, partial [Escherichia coli]|nr:ABC transporter permease subunit [Escherichia coli]